MSEKLKPCPFCGAEACIKHSWVPKSRHIAIGCSDDRGCPASNDEQDEQGGFSCEFDNFEDAARNWNTRPLEDALQARAEAAEKRVAELEAEMRWIPVTERLPEEKQEVIVITRNRFVCTWLYTSKMAQLFARYWTHWMPYKLPKEVEE